MEYTLEVKSDGLLYTDDNITQYILFNQIQTYHSYGNSVFIVYSYKEDTSRWLGQNTIKLDYSLCTSSTFTSVDDLLTYIRDAQVLGKESAAYDETINALQVSSITPEWAHYIDVEHPVSLTNTAADTYELVMDMEGFRSAAIQLHSVSTGTVTFKAFITLDEDAADDNFTDTSWIDATTNLFGSATITNADVSAIAFIETLRMPKKIGIQYVTSSAVNTVDIWVRKY